MAYRTSVHHYDLKVRDLLSEPDNKLRQILNHILEKVAGEPTLNIPFWQRDYDWDKEQIEKFLDSVHKVTQSKSELYLGTLVLGVHSEHPDKILVIDGQQRLRSIQNLLIRSQPLREPGRHTLVLPLVHGLGGAEKPIQTDEAVEESLAPGDQKNLFSRDNLCKRKFDNISPEDWLSLVWFRVVLTKYEFEGGDDERDPFDLVMSSLFANVNRQAKSLDDIDVVKAQILFGLRQVKRETEAEEFAREWETARMLQLVPTDRADRAHLETDVLDDKVEKILTAVPYDPETVRVQFSRYLLLVKAFAEGEAPPSDKEYQEITYKKVIRDEFEKLSQGENSDALVTFAATLKTVNDLFLANRDFLLLTRRNRVEVKEDDETRERLPLTTAQNRLLMFQGYVSSGTTRPNWLAHPMLMRLLRELPRDRKADDSEINGILERLESELFKDLDPGKKGEDAVLTARDWFLWRALFDVEGNPVFEAAVKGCDEMIKRAPASFTVDSGEALLRSFREIAKPYEPTGFPAATGAAEVEHWVALDRGKPIGNAVKEQLEKLSNKAHIANGLNQSMRNDGVLKKAANRERSWWPTLLFLAAYTLCGKDWAVAAAPLEEANLKVFTTPLDCFWETVAKTYETTNDAGREEG